MKFRWYWYLILSGLILIIGISFTVKVTLIDFFSGDKMIIEAPGDKVLTFSDSGKYTLFYEYDVRQIDYGIVKAGDSAI